MLWVLAEIQNNLVVNLISCEAENSFLFPDYIRVDNLDPQPGIGWSYVDGVFSPPPPPPPPPPVTVYSKFGFRSRFTLQELLGIDNFVVNPSLTDTQKAGMNTVYKSFDAAQDIDLTNQATIYGVNYIASCGLITEQRAKEILDPSFTLA